MGVITEFIVADKDDAKKVFEMDLRDRLKTYSSKEIRYLNSYHLEALLCVLKDVPFDTGKTYTAEKKFNASLSRRYPLLYEDDGFVWMYRVSGQLVSMLSKVDKKALKEVAKQWSETRLGWPWEDRGKPNRKLVLWALEELKELADLAAAAAEKIHVHVGLCLR